MSGKCARHDPATIAWLGEGADECPSWWDCGVSRGCRVDALLRYIGSPARKPLPGNPDYLTTSSRTEDRINDAQYWGSGQPSKRSL